MKRIEFFGTTDNLDVAEYVFHALLTQAEDLWNEYKTNHQEKYKNDPDYKYQNQHSRISKRAFMQGLVNGYTSKLNKEKTIIFNTISPDDKALISTGDKMLREAFDKKYHPCSHHVGCSNGKGYWDGHTAGSKLTLAQGVKAGTNRTLMLT
jgi:hypothetical protein